jgi:SAM-dependent methyltransferase
MPRTDPTDEIGYTVSVEMVRSHEVALPELKGASGMRQALFRWLDNPLVWGISRWLVDCALGLYRDRIRLLNRWGLLQSAPSVLDIGCGIGQYAKVTRGRYLGVDMSERYIDYAGRRYGNATRSFRCADVTRLGLANRTYQLVLMVDFLHHLSPEEVIVLLREAWRLSDGHVVSFEPTKEQSNFIGQWLVDHDRGAYMRPLRELHDLFEQAGLHIAESRELYLGALRTQAILCRKDQAASSNPVRRAG